MKIGFSYEEAGKGSAIVIEQVFAEKPGGGWVKNPDTDLPTGTAVGYDAAAKKFVAIKAARLVKANGVSDTTLEVAANSGIKAGEILGFGAKAVKVTKVEAKPDKDVLTLTMGVDIPKGAVVYQAKEASADAAAPLVTPEYVTGAPIEGGKGDQMVRLINGANLRKETANIGEDIAKVLTSIKLV